MSNNLRGNKADTMHLYCPQERKDFKNGFVGELNELCTTSRVAANLLLLIVMAILVSAVVWAANAPLDEVVKSLGKVIPSSEVKRVQNFEGGFVKEILVQEGQHVKKGQVLAILDQTQMVSRLRELQSSYLDQVATVARLKAELSGSVIIDFPSEITSFKPGLMNNQQELLKSRNASRLSAINVLDRDRQQKRQELMGLRSNLEYLQKKYALLSKELKMTKSMVARGAASEMDLLRIQQAVTELSGQIALIRLDIPKVKAAVEGAGHRVDELRENQRSDILEELSRACAKMDGYKEQLPAFEDKVNRTNVRSPVEGTVKQVFVTTIGEAISPGGEILEIVPREDTLLIEAKVSPRDIAFIRPGQDAKVKLTAYDSSIYGSMPGTVEYISSDAIADAELKTSYYQIKVRTATPMLKDHSGQDLPIIPGMIAEVDILTGKKTVLEYLLKPILKAKSNAMRER